MKRLLAVIGIVLAWIGTVRAEGTSQEKIYSRQKAFRIPFQIPDPAEQKQLQEVQLYVARNGGRWEQYTAAPPDVPPEKRSFTFRADQDGEYWFSVRTLDKHGVQNPEEESSLKGDLRVVVDSEIPKIELRPISRTGREVGVEWDIQDRNLDVDTLKLEYRVEGQESWQSVSGVVPKFIGQASWAPDAPGRVTVRCQVQDRAKNLGIVSIDVEPGTGAAPGRPSTSSPDGSGPALGATREKPPWPLENVPQRPAAGQGFQGGGTDRREPTDEPAQSQSAPKSPTPPPTPSDERPRNFGSPPNNLGQRGGPDSSATPSNRTLVRDSEISLNYEIDELGPSGVSVVELWITSDMGRTWQLFGTDPDRQSPLRAKLNGDGVFGLTLVAKNGLGVGERPPVSGDEPQTWVEVDSTAPQVRLFQPEIAKGMDFFSLTILWKAEDANLSDHPVSLFYTDAAQEDWKKIAVGIDNTGKYVWKLDGRVPPRFKIAIEVADQAGNNKRVESQDVTVDNSRPRPRVLRIEGAGTYRK